MPRLLARRLARSRIGGIGRFGALTARSAVSRCGSNALQVAYSGFPASGGKAQIDLVTEDRPPPASREPVDLRVVQRVVGRENVPLLEGRNRYPHLPQDGVPDESGQRLFDAACDVLDRARPPGGR